MRTLTLSGAAAVALGAAVAGAGPALAQTALTQGAAIAAPAGTCSITVVDATTAYTAAHCGAGAWSVGSPVVTTDGETVGTVAALPGTTGVDVVKIALADDVSVVGDWSTREAATVAPGETLYTHGSSVPLGHPNTLSHAETFDIGAVCGDAYADQVALDGATTVRGDSGGAVYDAQQRVVGVVSGLAPVTFDAEGNAVGCDAAQMSTIMVPVESFDAAAETAPAAEAEAPSGVEIGVDEADLPTAGEAPVPADEVTELTPAEQEALAAEMKARAAAEGTAAAAPAAEETVAVVEAEQAAGQPQVVAETGDAGMSGVTVTVVDAEGDVVAQDGLDLDGEQRAWLPVPAEVPAGGSVQVTVDGAPAQVTVDGVAVN